MVDFVIMPAVIMGILLGVIEIELVHNDERAYGMAWLGHALHALPTMFILVFISMNIHWAFALIGINLKENFMMDMIVRLVIGLIAMVEIMLKAAALKGTHLGEKFPHALFMGLLVAFSPYLWAFITPFTSKVPLLNK